MTEKHNSDSCYYLGTDRRKHCETVVLVTQKFNDFIERYERDQEFTREFRANQMESVKELAESMLKLKEELRETRKPYRILVWVLTIATGAFLIETIRWGIEFFKSRVHLG